MNKTDKKKIFDYRKYTRRWYITLDKIIHSGDYVLSIIFQCVNSYDTLFLKESQ